MYDKNPGKINLGSSQSEVRISEGSNHQFKVIKNRLQRVSFDTKWEIHKDMLAVTKFATSKQPLNTESAVRSAFVR